MELGLPTTNSGTNTTTQQGQGFAQVLDQSSFDPVAFVSNINAYRQKKESDAAKAALERRAKWSKVGAPNVSYVTDYNRKEIEGDLNAYKDYISEAMAQGVDPDTDYSLRDRLEKAQAGILQKEVASKQIDNVVQGYAEKAKDYNPEDWNKWMEGLKMQPTVQDRLNYVTTVTPFEDKIDVNELLGDVIDAELLQKITETPSRGNETIITGTTNPEDIKKVLDAGLYQNPATREKVDKLYRQGKEDGLWKDPYEFESFVFTRAKQFAKPDFEKREGARMSFGGGGSTTIPQQAEVNPAGQGLDVKVVDQATLDTYIDPKRGNEVYVSEKEGNKPKPDSYYLDKLSKTDLKSDVDKNTRYVFNIKDNTQAKEGNFVGVDGINITGKPNGTKFSQDGSLWLVMDGQFIPLELEPKTAANYPEAAKAASANIKQLENTLNKTWSVISNDIYSNKRGGTATPTGEKKKKPY